MSDFKHVTRDLDYDTSRKTNVYMIEGYPAGSTTLRIDSSCSRRGEDGERGKFDHAADVVLTPERATAIRDALDAYLESYTPDYAAMAADFKPGDLAIVGDEPGTGAEAGSGYVSPAYAGQFVTVAGVNGDTVRVQLRGYHCAQDVHVAHLTRGKVVPA